MKHVAILDRTYMEKARRERGYTQAQVAAAAGCSTPLYNRVEKGLHTPSVVIGLKIANFLGFNPQAFLTEKPIR